MQAPQKKQRSLGVLKGLHTGGSYNFSSRVDLSEPQGSLKGTQGTKISGFPWLLVKLAQH